MMKGQEKKMCYVSIKKRVLEERLSLGSEAHFQAVNGAKHNFYEWELAGTLESGMVFVRLLFTKNNNKAITARIK